MIRKLVARLTSWLDGADEDTGGDQHPFASDNVTIVDVTESLTGDVEYNCEDCPARLSISCSGDDYQTQQIVLTSAQRHAENTGHQTTVMFRNDRDGSGAQGMDRWD